MVPDGEFYLVRNAGHFLQEDAGNEVATRLIHFLDKRIKPRIEPQAVAV
jgi:pimeloyl-ACP methyl ester carboxylesterase